MDDITMRGHVDAFLVAPDGKRTPAQAGANTVSYACAEAVARLFAGQGGGPTRVVFAHADTTDKTFNFVSGDRDKAESDILGTDLQAASVAIDASPSISASDASKYKTGGNVVTLRATMSSDAAFYIYGYMLEDAAGHVLAVRKLDNPVQKPEGYAFAVSWAITFA